MFANCEFFIFKFSICTGGLSMIHALKNAAKMDAVRKDKMDPGDFVLKL